MVFRRTTADSKLAPSNLRPAREQETQRIWNTQHPLAYRLLGEDLIDQQRRALGHAPSATTRAETSPFATERHQVLGMAGVAAHPQETVLETTALEVVFELLLDIPRQGRTLYRQVGLEGGIVFLGIFIPTVCGHSWTGIWRSADISSSVPCACSCCCDL